MIRNILEDKISKVSMQESDFKSGSQLALIRKASDYIQQEASRQWFCSLHGMSTSQAESLVNDSQGLGFAVLRPKEKDYEILFNPKFVDDLQGGPGGKTFSVSLEDGLVHFAELMSKDKKTPTVVATSTKGKISQDSTTNSSRTIQTNQVALPSNVNNTVNSNDFITGSIKDSSPLVGQIGGNDSPADPYSSNFDIQADGSKKPTTDTGTAPSGQSIRVGTLMLDPHYLNTKTKSVPPNSINGIVGAVGK